MNTRSVCKERCFRYSVTHKKPLYLYMRSEIKNCIKTLYFVNSEINYRSFITTLIHKGFIMSVVIKFYELSEVSNHSTRDFF